MAAVPPRRGRRHGRRLDGVIAPAPPRTSSASPTSSCSTWSRPSDPGWRRHAPRRAVPRGARRPGARLRPSRSGPCRSATSGPPWCSPSTPRCRWRPTTSRRTGSRSPRRQPALRRRPARSSSTSASSRSTASHVGRGRPHPRTATALVAAIDAASSSARAPPSATPSSPRSTPSTRPRRARTTSRPRPASCVMSRRRDDRRAAQHRGGRRGRRGRRPRRHDRLRHPGRRDRGRGRRPRTRPRRARSRSPRSRPTTGGTTFEADSLDELGCGLRGHRRRRRLRRGRPGHQRLVRRRRDPVARAAGAVAAWSQRLP